MRSVLLFIAAILPAPAFASAQSPPAKDLRTLFDVVQALGTDTELRGDISDRLGFGEHPLPIKDLVVTVNGTQHALNAFMASDKSYLLFDSHLDAPEIYIFVKNMDGTLVAGIHGRQYQPITDTINLTPNDVAPLASAEESFWFQWLAAGAKVPTPAN